MDTTAVSMESDGDHSSSRCDKIDDECEKYRQEIAKLQDQLAREVEHRDATISQLNEGHIQLVKENEMLKHEITNLNELNATYQVEISQLRQISETNQQSNDSSSDVDLNVIQENRKSLQYRLTELIDELHKKTVDFQNDKKEKWFENIEMIAKMKQSDDDLSLLKAKNKFAQKLIISKDEYIDYLSKHIDSLKANYCNLECVFNQEISIQNNKIANALENIEKMQNVHKTTESRLITNQMELHNSVEKMNQLQQKIEFTEHERDQHVAKLAQQEEFYRSEVNRLTELLKQSKNEIVDQYIEKLYPNIVDLCKMFDRQMSISQLYSQYLQYKKSSEDLAMEKAVFIERLNALQTELSTTQATAKQRLEQIEQLRKLEGTIVQLEGDKKELAVSLHFYQESANNMYKCLKSFHEYCVDFSRKAHQHLAVQSDSSDTNARVCLLEFVPQVQNKCTEFNNLQSEFEKGKIDFLSKKQNLIETGVQVESLRGQVSQLETEKRVLEHNCSLLKDQYELLQSLFNSHKFDSFQKEASLVKDNKQLKVEISALNEEKTMLNAKGNSLQEEIAKCKVNNQQLESKLNALNNETDFIKQQLTVQQQFGQQLQKSLVQLRSLNENLRKLNKQLMQKFTQENDIDANHHKMARLESELNKQKLNVCILNEKLATLTQNESLLNVKTFENLLNDLKNNTKSFETGLITRIETMTNEKFNLINFNKEHEQLWLQEKKHFEARIAELESLFQNEANKVSILQENYTQLQQLKSPAIEENASIDEILKSENDLLKSQLENMNQQFQELSQELSTFKQKCLELSQENRRVQSSKNELQFQLSVLNNEKANLTSELNQMQTVKQQELTQLEIKLKNTSEQQLTALNELRVEFNEKQTACELYLRQIETLNQTVSDLNCQLQQASLNVTSNQEQVNICLEANDKLQKLLDQQTVKHVEDVRTIGELRKRIEELQNRINECESQRLHQEKVLTDKLTGFSADNDRLREEQRQLQALLEQLSIRSEGLVIELNHLRQQFIDDPIFLSKQDQLIEWAHLSGFIEILQTEKRLLMSKCDTYQAKEVRLNQEINHLKQDLNQLEQCLKKETENVENLKQMYISIDDKEESRLMSDTIQILRAARDKFERDCELYQLKLGQLEQKLQNNDSNQLQKTINDSQTQIKTLNSQLSSCTNENKQLNQKLKSEQETIKKLQNDIHNLTVKFEQQSNQLDTIRNELNSKTMLQDKYQSELEGVKSSLAESDNNKSSLEKETQSLRKEVISLQNINQQLKVLARKYKSQCDELQKQTQSQSEQISQALEISTVTAAKDEQIKELETRNQALESQYEMLKEKVDNLNKQNEELVLQITDKDQKAKRFAQQVRDKISEKNKVIASLQEEVVNIRESVPRLLAKKSSSCSSTSVTVPTGGGCSSSFLESGISSNFLSSSSNEVPTNVGHLQSAHITSHSSTTMGDRYFPASGSNTDQLSDSNVTSNKRGYRSDDDQQQQQQSKKTRINESHTSVPVRDEICEVENYDQDSEAQANPTDDNNQTNQIRLIEPADGIVIEAGENDSLSAPVQSDNSNSSVSTSRAVNEMHHDASMDTDAVTQPTPILMPSSSNTSNDTLDNNHNQPEETVNNDVQSSASADSPQAAIPSNQQPSECVENADVQDFEHDVDENLPTEPVEWNLVSQAGAAATSFNENSSNNNLPTTSNMPEVITIDDDDDEESNNVHEMQQEISSQNLQSAEHNATQEQSVSGNSAGRRRLKIRKKLND